MEYQNRNEANRAQTEQHIKDVFIDMFVEQGLDSISVKALSERAHISKTTFYKYFDDKYELLEVIETDILDALTKINLEIIPVDFKEALKQETIPGMTESARFIRKHKKIFKRLLDVNMNQHFVYHWKKNIKTEFLDKFRKDNLQSKDLEMNVEMIVSALVGLYTFWLFHRPRMSCEEFSRIAANMVLKYIYS